MSSKPRKLVALLAAIAPVLAAILVALATASHSG